MDRLNYLTLSAPRSRRPRRCWRLRISRAGIATTIVVIIVLVLLWLATA